jgi:hypothetical protein
MLETAEKRIQRVSDHMEDNRIGEKEVNEAFKIHDTDDHTSQLLNDELI